jgi:hypothetical protein
LDARKGTAAIADGYGKARAPLRAKAALLASPLSIKSASIFRAREANARNQSEGSFFFDERYSGEFRKRSKYDFTCCNGYRIKRADGLLKLPDTFAVLDLDLEIARFAPDLDDLMASTRQSLLNQFADLSVCANQHNFHRNSILPA